MSNGDHHNVIQTRKMSNKQAIFKESSSTKKGPLARYVDRLHDRYGEMFQRSSFKDPWARSEARRLYSPRMNLFRFFPGIGLGFFAFLTLCACEHIYYKFKPPEEYDHKSH